MTYEDLLLHYDIFEKSASFFESTKSEHILSEFEKKTNPIDPANLRFKQSFAGQNLLRVYFEIKGTDKEKILEKLLEENNAHYSYTIHNAIYNLLVKKEEYDKRKVNPLLWPGINSITGKSNEYTLKTKLGKIKVSKASKIFENTSSSYIFNKELLGKCYYRCYDFLKENSDQYKAVLSYLPNFFHGGHFHTYLENDTHVLDIASNAYYEKEYANIVLSGEIIAKLTFEEVEKQYEELITTIPEIKEYPKLGTLALYHDVKRVKQK